MKYVQGILSGIAAISLASFLPGGGIFNGYRGIFEHKATGVGVIEGGITGSLYSPLFWIFAIVLFALFFAASRLGNKILRVLLFWIPTILISTVGVAMSALLTYMFLHFRTH